MFCADKSRSEGCHIKNDHDEREEIHSHRKADPGVHPANEDQPNLPCLAVPNKKRISSFEQANNNSYDWENKLPPNKYLRIDNVERRTDESAPHIRAIPPPAAEAFRQAAEKIDDAQVKLQDAPPESQKLRIF